MPDDTNDLQSHLAPFSMPSMPIDVLTRTHTMLRLSKEGLRMMAGPNEDQVILGFFSIAVFGRAVTSALQNLRTFDTKAFNEWYAPWLREMSDDPLCRYFYKLRSDILKGISPFVGYLIASYGPNSRPIGTVLVPGRPIPTTHRGQPIKDSDMRHLCELYVDYLEKLVTSATSVVVAVQERWNLPAS